MKQNLRLWKQPGIDVAIAKDGWYRKIGQGVGPALNMASSSNTCRVSDRGTSGFRSRTGRSKRS
jgi:tungstate transport system substrate-binding protein